MNALSDDIIIIQIFKTKEALRREVASVWGSDEIRRIKPTPQMEARLEIIFNKN